MTQHTFLVEIGTEELPSKTLRSLAESFAVSLTSELKYANIEHGSVSWFATPRRLALKVANLSSVQSDRIIKKRGPVIGRIFNNTVTPNKEAEKWAHSCGITIDQAKCLVTKKGDLLLHSSCVKGKPVQKLLNSVVNNALSKLPIPKLMRWGDSEVRFARPVHTVTMLLDTELIPGNVLGVECTRTIRGHRFMGETEFTIDKADQYPKILIERGKVIADYKVRKALIKRGVQRAAAKIGGKADLSDSLLEEVVSLVEWPIVLTAKFEEKFLAVPIEALVYTMKSDQKYFPVYDSVGNLLPNFIFVANIESKDPQQIITGNEKVIRSRLVDAEFFFNNDRKKRLVDHLPSLESIVFQQKLGTLRDKTDRIQRLSGWIASQIGADVSNAIRAGLLSKCDLMTNMVFEFTKTQGVIGMYYARYDGEEEEVAIALNEQYRPRFSGDELPRSLVSCALAIADKIDTLTGMLGIGQYPKGDKDPFALRRAALGVLRIIIEKKLPLDLQILTEEAALLYGKQLTNVKVVNDVLEFMLGRFRVWYQEAGYPLDTIQAVLAIRPIKPADFDARVKAVSYFRTLEEAESLVATNKRISNILSKSTDTLNDHVQTLVLQEAVEIQLASQLTALRDKLKLYIASGNYQDALMELTSVRGSVDSFFKNVMVMTKNDAVRVNRLTLLNKLRELFLQVADISLLQ